MTSKAWATREKFDFLKIKNLKEINPEYSSEGLILKVKLQYFEYLMQRWERSLGKILVLGKIEGRRRRGTEDEMVEWHH